MISMCCSRSSFFNLIRLKKLLREQHIDIIQVNDFYNLLGAAAKLTGFRGKLLVYVRFLPASLPSVLSKLWIRAAQLRSARLIAVSDAVLKQLPSRAGAVRIYDPVLLAEVQPQRDYNSESEVQFVYLAN